MSTKEFKLTITDICMKQKMYLQQNSFNPISDNPESLIIWHLRRVVPRLEVLLFTSKHRHHWTRQISGTCSKTPPRVSLLVWYFLTRCFLLHQLLHLWKLQKTQERIWWPWTSGWRSFSNGILLCLVLQPIIGAVMKNYLEECKSL